MVFGGESNLYRRYRDLLLTTPYPLSKIIFGSQSSSSNQAKWLTWHSGPLRWYPRLSARSIFSVVGGTNHTQIRRTLPGFLPNPQIERALGRKKSQNNGAMPPCEGGKKRSCRTESYSLRFGSRLMPRKSRVKMCRGMSPEDGIRDSPE